MTAGAVGKKPDRGEQGTLNRGGGENFPAKPEKPP